MKKRLMVEINVKYKGKSDYKNTCKEIIAVTDNSVREVNAL